MKRNRYIYLLMFVQGVTLSEFLRGKTTRQKIRLCWRLFRRQPETFYWLWVASMVKWGTNTKHIHVLPGDSQVFVDWQFQGPTFVPHEDAIKQYKGINGWVAWVSPEPIDLSQFERPTMGRLRWAWNLFYAHAARWLMWLTRGWYQPVNCTTIARKVLADGGVNAPRSCWNPGLLLLWLTENRHAFTPGAPPSACGSTHRGTGDTEPTADGDGTGS